MKKRSILVGLFAAATISLLLYPVVFGQARARSNVKGGPLAQALSEKNRELSREILDAINRRDFPAAERALKTWEQLPGVFGKNDGYWLCMIRLRKAQGRWGEAADAYRKVYGFESTLRTDPGFLCSWSLATAKAGRPRDVVSIFELLANTEEFQRDPVLSTIPLSRLAGDARSVEAVYTVLGAKNLLNEGRYEEAKEYAERALSLRPDLEAGKQLRALALRRQDTRTLTPDTSLGR